MSVFGVILVRIFRHLDYSDKMRKMRTRITPNMDTFHAVKKSKEQLLLIKCQIYLSLRVFRIHIDWLVSFDRFKPGILFSLNPFAACDPLLGSEYRPIFEQQCLENSKNKRFFNSMFLEGYLNKRFS